MDRENRHQQDEEDYRTYSRYVHEDEKQNTKRVFSTKAAVVIVVLLFITADILGWMVYRQDREERGTSYESLTESAAHSENAGNLEAAVEAEETETEETETEETQAAEQISFSPHAVESTRPENMISYTEVEYNGTQTGIEDIVPWYQIDFAQGSAYTEVDGIVTFRGNNFRDNPTYGSADISAHSITGLWNVSTGTLTYNGTTWTGNGWTGQPLMRKWPAEVKQHMNMYDWAKEKEDLVEVIYAAMDGYVYFLDLQTGESTRDALYLGWTFKGAGALDPRGYPILYLGAGYDSTAGTARVFIVNLLDGCVMYTFGNNDTFSLRGTLSYFDSSPLVDAQSDTLIYPGENGILYLIHLGTAYDEEAGTLSVEPDQILKWRYYGERTSASSYWLGMEDSAAVYGGYMFIADNGGHLMSLNLNTLELVWVQDILDDSNSTPVLSIEDGHVYLYVSTSFRKGWRSSVSAVVPIWKIDAQTGEIVWQTEYEVYTQDSVSGGVQSTIALGTKSLDDYLYVTVSMVGNAWEGVLSCLDKETGQVQWEHNAAYSWSSPVCVYDETGAGEVIYGDFSGTMYVLDGLTGEVYSSVSISTGVIEASPAVYDNYLVIGTRACRIWGLQLG